jgi:hypothetical protein
LARRQAAAAAVRRWIANLVLDDAAWVVLRTAERPEVTLEPWQGYALVHRVYDSLSSGLAALRVGRVYTREQLRVAQQLREELVAEAHGALETLLNFLHDEYLTWIGIDHRAAEVFFEQFAIEFACSIRTSKVWTLAILSIVAALAVWTLEGPMWLAIAATACVLSGGVAGRFVVRYLLLRPWRVAEWDRIAQGLSKKRPLPQ